MHYTINLSDDKTFLVQKMWGAITCEVALKSAEECHSMGKKLGILRFLVDATEARNVESVLRIYDFAYRGLDVSQVDRRARVALLVDPSDTSHDFLETLCRNAGHDVTLFRERESAERHLHSKDQ